MTALTELDLGPGTVLLRRAERRDIEAIVGLIAADQLGAARDGIRDEADLAAYRGAFEAIDADPAHLLLAAESEGRVVGTMQLSFLPGLARRGALRAQIEAVRVADEHPRQRARRGHDRLGDRGGQAARLRAGAADHGQVAHRRAPVLPAARLRRVA